MRNSLLIFTATLLLASCWNNKTNNQHQTEGTEDSKECAEIVQFTECSYDKKIKIFDSEYPKYDIDIQVQYVKGDTKVAQTINKQLATFLFGTDIMPFEKAKTCFADSLAESFEKELKDFYEPDNEYQEIFAYEYTQKGTVSEDTPGGIIAYTNRIETYTGGAHGGAIESYINFNEKTGKIITCEELFGNNQDAVKKLIKEQIIKDNDCKTATELEEKRSIFSLGDVYISNNNFRIEKVGVLFCYNPYDIAPWSEGFIFARLSYKELEGLITPNLIKN